MMQIIKRSSSYCRDYMEACQFHQLKWWLQAPSLCRSWAVFLPRESKAFPQELAFSVEMPWSDRLTACTMNHNVALRQGMKWSSFRPWCSCMIWLHEVFVTSFELLVAATAASSTWHSHKAPKCSRLLPVLCQCPSALTLWWNLPH